MRLSAQAGEAVILLGSESGKENEAESALEGHMDRKEAMGIAKACRTMGGTLEAVGQVIEALVSPEILRAKWVVYLSSFSVAKILTFFEGSI